MEFSVRGPSSEPTKCIFPFSLGFLKQMLRHWQQPKSGCHGTGGSQWEREGCQRPGSQSLLPALMLTEETGRIGRGRVGHPWLVQEGELWFIIQEVPTSAGGSPKDPEQAAVKAVPVFLPRT